MTSGYNSDMGRRYRRYYGKRRSGAGSGWLLIFIILAAAWHQFRGQDMSQILTYVMGGVVIVLTAVITVVIWRYKTEQRKLRALDTAAVDDMDPLEFERYVATLLRNRGFRNVALTERYDYGVDIIAHKDGVSWGVQVKHYKNLVKAEAVRQVFTALVRYKCERAMVVTNSVFSRPAKELPTIIVC